MHKDNLMAELKTAVNVALLKHDAMHSVASDKKKTSYAFGILAVAALASGLGMKLFGNFITPSWWMVLSMAIYQIISAILGIYVVSIVAKSIFKGTAKHDAFFRVMAFGMIVTWLSIFPLLSIIGGIWALVIVCVILKVVHKLTTGGIIGTLLVSIVVMALISLLLSPVLATLGLRGAYTGHFEYKNGVGMMEMPNAGDFKMNVDTDDGQGSVEMKDGKMVIEGPDGKKMEVTIPDYN